MKNILIILVLINFSGQIYSQTATTLIEVLNPRVMFPTIPSISDNSVAFIDYRNYRYSLFLVDINTKLEQLLIPNLGYPEPYISLSKNQVVWVGYPTLTQADVYLLNISSNVISRITEDAAFQNYPDIHKNKIVWQDYRNAAINSYNADIYLYDLLNGQTMQITTDSSYQTFPAIWENLIVWEDYRNAHTDTTNADIYLYDLLTNQEIQITSDPSAQLNPDIWEDKIVWEDYRNGVCDIYMYDLSTNTERAISNFNAYKAYPVIYRNWIVWQDYRNGAYADIYGFNLITNQEYPIILQSHHQEFVALDSLNLIWQDFRDYRQDLYRAILINPDIPFLKLNSPNGGENWFVGNTYNITWNWNSISEVKLEYTTDNGGHWLTITEATACDGSFNWIIPNTPSTQCLIKITDLSDPMIMDVSDSNFSVEGISLVQDDLFNSSIPGEFNLHQNFPNPFNPNTSIYYSLPYPSFVKIEIFTLLGEKISELVNGYKNAGNHVEIFNSSNHNTGIYLCVMKAGDFLKTTKMLLLK
jgi:beta propeller repeat protein